MNKDKYFMKKALLLAEEARNNNEIPVGAVLVKDNKIIAQAYNQKDSKKIVTKHAELITIEEACHLLNDWRLYDTTLYVTMEPCPMCASAIQQARIKKIVYGCSSNNNENTIIINKILKNTNYNHSVEICNGVLQEECSMIIKNFFKTKRDNKNN